MMTDEQQASNLIETARQMPPTQMLIQINVALSHVLNQLGALHEKINVIGANQVHIARAVGIDTNPPEEKEE